jgi:hypothetical protein
MKPFANPFAGKSYSARDIIPIAAIAGIISIAAMGINFKFGLVLLGLTIGALAGIVRSTRPKLSDRPTTQFVQYSPPIKTVFSEYDITEKPANPQVTIKPKPQPAQPIPAQPLLNALRADGYILNSPVVYLGDNPAITAQDVIITIAEIMAEKKDSISDMVKLMPDMYNLLWDFTGEATDKYGDLELIKLYIAGKIYFQVTATKPAL